MIAKPCDLSANKQSTAHDTSLVVSTLFWHLYLSMLMFCVMYIEVLLMVAPLFAIILFCVFSYFGVLWLLRSLLSFAVICSLVCCPPVLVQLLFWSSSLQFLCEFWPFFYCWSELDEGCAVSVVLQCFTLKEICGGSTFCNHAFCVWLLGCLLVVGVSFVFCCDLCCLLFSFSWSCCVGNLLGSFCVSVTFLLFAVSLLLCVLSLWCFVCFPWKVFFWWDQSSCVLLLVGCWGYVCLLLWFDFLSNVALLFLCNSSEFVQFEANLMFVLPVCLPEELELGSPCPILCSV